MINIKKGLYCMCYCVTFKKSVDDLARTMSLNISKVWLKTETQQILVSASDIRQGDEVVVHMGNIIPFDGIVTEGEAMVNQASLTGESEPVSKDVDDIVYAGSIVEDGELVIRVTAAEGKGRYDRIVQMIEETEKLKSSMEGLFAMRSTLHIFLYTHNLLCYNIKKERDNMDAVKNVTYTIDDIYALPDGQRAELIDGVIYNMSPPSFRHQKILSFLHIEIGNYIRKNNSNCEAIPLPFAVFLNNNKTTYVEPDISVICDKNKLDDHGCNGAPDWIIEIVSPSSKRMDYMIKLFKYRSSGVREYWIVDPIKNLVTTYNFENEAIEIYGFTDKVKAGIYEDLEIDFSEINN